MKMMHSCGTSVPGSNVKLLKKHSLVSAILRSGGGELLHHFNPIFGERFREGHKDQIWYIMEDWYPEMFDNPLEDLYDVTGSESQETLLLVPAESVAIWRGHWGELDASGYPNILVGDTDDGPRSPKWRQGAGEHIYLEPAKYYNATLPDDDTDLEEIY